MLDQLQNYVAYLISTSRKVPFRPEFPPLFKHKDVVITYFEEGMDIITGRAQFTGYLRAMSLSWTAQYSLTAVKESGGGLVLISSKPLYISSLPAD
jgi:hypothetical protein